MCVVSNMGDMGRGMWPEPWESPKPWKSPSPYEPFERRKAVPMPGIDYPIPSPPPAPTSPVPTREQFEEFLKLLRAARSFDKATGQPDCEQDEKIKWIRELAKFLGVDPAKVGEALK